MFGRRITLFSLFGFEVRLDASWIVIATLIAWSLASAVFPSEYPGLPAGAYWWMGIAGALGLFGSIVIHELCHSLVARHYQLPMKGITLFIFGGVAEMGGEPQSPKVEFLMAIAGPIASIILGALFHIVRMTGGGSVEWLGIAGYLGWINWILAAFNLIPAFPLDGGRVLRAALWRFKGDLTGATRIASRVGSGFGILLMVYGFYQLFFGNLISAIWMFLIGMFLRGAARMSYEQVLLRSALAGETVRRFMHPDPVAAPPEISVRQFVEDYIYRYHFKVFPVVEGESRNLIGCVSTADLKEVPREEWDRRHVSEVTKPCSTANTIGPDADALQAFSKIQENGSGALFVTERNHLLATVSPRDVLRFMAAKMELEGRRGLLPAPRV